MQYVARITKDGRYWCIDFPDAVGCVTFTEKKADIEVTAFDALVSWLEAELIMGNTPPTPIAMVTDSSIVVEVPPRLAVAVELKRANDVAKLI